MIREISNRTTLEEKLTVDIYMTLLDKFIKDEFENIEELSKLVSKQTISTVNQYLKSRLKDVL